MADPKGSGFFASVDRLIVATYPLMVGCCVIGIVCGIVLAFLGIGHSLGWIHLGSMAEDLGPLWLIGGGLGIAVGALGGIFTFQEKREESLGRLGQGSGDDLP